MDFELVIALLRCVIFDMAMRITLTFEQGRRRTRLRRKVSKV